MILCQSCLSKMKDKMFNLNTCSKYQGGIKHRKGKHFNQIIHTPMNAEGQELMHKKENFFFKLR